MPCDAVLRDAVLVPLATPYHTNLCYNGQKVGASLAEPAGSAVSTAARPRPAPRLPSSTDSNTSIPHRRRLLDDPVQVDDVWCANMSSCLYGDVANVPCVSWHLKPDIGRGVRSTVSHMKSDQQATIRTAEQMTSATD